MPLITIDVGANDLNSCVSLGSISAVAACAGPKIQAAAQNLAVTLAQLHQADPHATIAGMTYYVPELAAWLTGPAGQAFAQGAVPLAQALNGALSGAFATVHAPVADVFGAFSSADFTDTVTLPGLSTVPKNVAVICQLTWECAPAPVGPNEHANAAGYGVIASAFLAVLPAGHEHTDCAAGSGRQGAHSSSAATSSQRSSRLPFSASTALSAAPSSVSNA